MFIYDIHSLQYLSTLLPNLDLPWSTFGSCVPR